MSKIVQLSDADAAVVLAGLMALGTVRADALFLKIEGQLAPSPEPSSGGYEPRRCQLEHDGKPYVDKVDGRHFVLRQFPIFGRLRTEILCSPHGYGTYDEAESSLLKAFPLNEGAN